MTIDDIKILLRVARTCSHIKMCSFQVPIREVYNGELDSETPKNTALIVADGMVRISVNDLLECKVNASGSIKIGLVEYRFMRPATIDVIDAMRVLKGYEAQNETI